MGLIENVTLENGKTYRAKIDTGADSSSIDSSIAQLLGEKPILSHKYIRSALGRDLRPIISIDLEIRGLKCNENFTISNREHLKFKILIGKDILQKENFLVDPSLDDSDAELESDIKPEQKSSDEGDETLDDVVIVTEEAER